MRSYQSQPDLIMYNRVSKPRLYNGCELNTLLLSYPAISPPRQPATMPPPYPATPPPRHPADLPPSYPTNPAIQLWSIYPPIQLSNYPAIRYHATSLPRHLATLLPRYPVIPLIQLSSYNPSIQLSYLANQGCTWLRIRYYIMACKLSAKQNSPISPSTELSVTYTLCNVTPVCAL